MRTLCVMPRVPPEGFSGGDWRNRAILRALARHGPVTAMAFQGDASLALPGNAALVMPPGGARAIWSRPNPLRPLSHPLGAADLRWMDDVMARLRPDLVVVEGVLLRDAITIARARGIAAVLDMHNVESELLPALLRLRRLRWLPQNLLGGLLRRALAAREDARAGRAASAVWACSARDAALWQARTGQSAHLVPNPLPDPALLDIPIAPARYARPDQVYVGNYFYGPNREGAVILAREVIPHLPPGTRAVIAGGNLPAWLRKMGEAGGAIMHDSPPDMAPLLAAAGYSVMPVMTGGGTRLKALEAMAAGAVVVATDKAVEGLELRDGDTYVAAQTPAQMLAVLARLTADPAGTAELARRARAFVLANHGPDAIQAAVSAGLAGIAAQR